MKIQVQASGHNINIPIPTGLIFSRPVVWMYLRFARKHAGEAMNRLPDKAVYALCAELKRCKRRHGTWNLVEVEASSGETVLIRL